MRIIASTVIYAISGIGVCGIIGCYKGATGYSSNVMILNNAVIEVTKIAVSYSNNAIVIVFDGVEATGESAAVDGKFGILLVGSTDVARTFVFTSKRKISVLNQGREAAFC